jgi:dolichol-phosphate mannosyltransferase
MGASRVCLGLKTRDVTSGFRTWRRGFIEGLPVLELKSNGYAFQEEMLLVAERAGGRITEIPVVFVDRVYGASKLGLRDVQDFFYTLARLTVVRRRRFFLYAAIGLLGAIVDFGVFVALHHHFGWSVLPANVLAASMAPIHNFLWHHHLTFRHHRQHAHVAFAIFLAVSCVGIALNSVLVLGGISLGMLPVVAKVMAICGVTVWNYVLNSRVTFRT